MTFTQMGKELIEAIINPPPIPKPEIYAPLTDAELSRFKRLLATVKLKAYTRGRVVYVRPDSVPLFITKCKENGLANCEPVMIALNVLNERPAEFLRIGVA